MHINATARQNLSYFCQHKITNHMEYLKIIHVREKSYIYGVFFPPVDNIFHFHNLGCFYSPSVMHFHGPGSVIICPTAKSLVFLTKCMYLWLWSCRAQWYLPLSAALGGFCVALQKVCCVPETRHLTKQDGFPAGRPAGLLISLCEIPERGGIRLK